MKLLCYKWEWFFIWKISLLTRPVFMNGCLKEFFSIRSLLHNVHPLPFLKYLKWVTYSTYLIYIKFRFWSAWLQWFSCKVLFLVCSSKSLIKIVIFVIFHPRENIICNCLVNFSGSFVINCTRKCIREIHSEMNFEDKKEYNYMTKHKPFLERKIKKYNFSGVPRN